MTLDDMGPQAQRISSFQNLMWIPWGWHVRWPWSSNLQPSECTSSARWDEGPMRKGNRTPVEFYDYPKIVGVGRLMVDQLYMNLQLHACSLILGVMLRIIVRSTSCWYAVAESGRSLHSETLVMPWCNLPPLHRYVSIDVITVFVTRNGFAWCLDHDFFQLKVNWTIPKDDLHLPSNAPETPPNARWFGRFRIDSPQEMLEVILGELKPRQLSRADGQSFHLQKDGWQANLGSPERWDGGKSPFGALDVKRM